MFECAPLWWKGQLSAVTASANPSGLLRRTNLTRRTVKLASADTTEWKRVLRFSTPEHQFWQIFFCRSLKLNQHNSAESQVPICADRYDKHKLAENKSVAVITLKMMVKQKSSQGLTGNLKFLNWTYLDLLYFVFHVTYYILQHKWHM